MLPFHLAGTGRLRRALDVTAFVCGLGALGLLVIEFGFPLTSAHRSLVFGLVRAVLWAVLAVQVARVLMDALGRRPTLGCYLSLGLHASLGVLLALENVWVASLVQSFGGTTERWTLLGLTALHITIVGTLAQRLLTLNEQFAFARISPRAILIGSYVVLILAGTALLKLPNATHSSISWLDALFTSTSAVSVTGLIVVDTATVFTVSGQAVILLLLQVGGLGLMTFTYFFVTLFGRGLTLRDRSFLLDFLNEDHVGRVTGSLIAIIALTVCFEAIGAIALWAFTPGAGWFESVFHSISAFCNAGFSIYSAGLYDPLTRVNAPYQAVIMVLIVVGGLGFPVLKNLWDRSRSLRPGERPHRLTTHSRVVLVTTGTLIVVGAVVIYIFELRAGTSHSVAEQWLAAVFNSITSRTAGFNTVPIEALSAPTVVIMMVLMFIGGSPAGTAGGIKTTTFAIALLNTLHILKDAGRDLVAFRRQIPGTVASRAFAVALLGLAWVVITTILLLWLMPDHRPLDVAFEAVSAFATVGLSRGLTAQLPDPAKVILIASMFIGRIGILYVALGVMRRNRLGRIGYPEGNVIIS